MIQNDVQQQINVGPFDFKTKFSNLDDKYYQLPDRIKCDGKYRPEDLLASNKPEQHMQTTDIILKRFSD